MAQFSDTSSTAFRSTVPVQPNTTTTLPSHRSLEMVLDSRTSGNKPSSRNDKSINSGAQKPPGVMEELRIIYKEGAIDAASVPTHGSRKRNLLDDFRFLLAVASQIPRKYIDWEMLTEQYELGGEGRQQQQSKKTASSKRRYEAIFKRFNFMGKQREDPSLACPDSPETAVEFLKKEYSDCEESWRSFMDEKEDTGELVRHARVRWSKKVDPHSFSVHLLLVMMNQVRERSLIETGQIYHFNWLKICEEVAFPTSEAGRKRFFKMIKPYHQPRTKDPTKNKVYTEKEYVPVGPHEVAIPPESDHEDDDESCYAEAQHSSIIKHRHMDNLQSGRLHQSGPNTKSSSTDYTSRYQSFGIAFPSYEPRQIKPEDTEFAMKEVPLFKQSTHPADGKQHPQTPQYMSRLNWVGNEFSDDDESDCEKWNSSYRATVEHPQASPPDFTGSNSDTALHSGDGDSEYQESLASDEDADPMDIDSAPTGSKLKGRTGEVEEEETSEDDNAASDED